MRCIQSHRFGDAKSWARLDFKKMECKFLLLEGQIAQSNTKSSLGLHIGV